MRLARQIARFGCGLRLEDVPNSVVASAKLHFVDALGVGLAAATVPPSDAWSVAGRKIGGDGPSTVLGRTRGSTPLAAALVNGALIHALEFDDTHVPSVVHGSSVAAPIALAVAEEEGATGAALLRGYLVCWEIMIRLGLAAPGTYQANGFQVTAVAGAVGAAATAASIGGMGEDATVAALGLAGSQASGLMEFLSDGATAKALNPGWAAHTGVTAAALAAAGMTGPERVIEGRFGFLAAFARADGAADRLAGQLDSLGSVWHLPQAAFKLYPCCHYIHPFLEAVALAVQGLRPDVVAAITCHVPTPMAPLICEPWERRQNPASGYDGKWGLAYCIAALLLNGRVDVATFSAPPDPEIAAWARRVEWTPMETHAFPDRFDAMVDVTLADGATRRQQVDDVRGGPARPIPAGDIEAKFAANAGRALRSEAVESVWNACCSLDTAGDLNALTSALRSVRPRA